MQLIDHLRKIFGPDRILSTELWRDVYGRDASYFNIVPQAVVRPQTVDEISSLLALATSLGVGVTFRTGGTSLSGQALGSGIICELRTSWGRCEVRSGGRKVWFEPGITAERLNAALRPCHTRIGPDPASSSAAMMGGILSNNSSGMQAGVAHNSYHTLSAIEFMLADGHRYNTALAADRRRFEADEAELCRGLMDIRSRILASAELTEKITRKYAIKNVTGYAMNSFVDFDNPFDIFAHLLIGSEGTLAYIIAGELDTLPLYDVYSSAMLYFSDVTTAAAQAAWLGQSGALAVEMMDYASLISYTGARPTMPEGTTALLIDYGADSPEEMQAVIDRLTPQLKGLKGLTHTEPFTHTVAEREALWKMRDGIFPCVAGARPKGATVILEDVAAPVEKLDSLVDGVQRLFGRHGYQGAIFGHARDGNIHPMLTPMLGQETTTLTFKRFMDDLVSLVISLDGSLKGEHGTGRAIAPFVEREWGPEIYAMMKELKQLADPAGILNPGVMINSDPESFLKPMKDMPVFGEQLGYDRADKCIECGYCEHVCPTRNITLTPRQRLQALRVIARAPEERRDGLRRQYRFIGRDSCCSDGSCQMPCPMGISTAEVTDRVREATASAPYKAMLRKGADRYGAVESAIRGVLRMAVATEKVISPYPLIWASDLMHRLCDQVPHWSEYFAMPARIHYNSVVSPDYVYFPACVTRIFGGSTLGKDDLVTVVLRLAERAGFRMSLPRDMHGLCCSQIWEHKGDPEGRALMANTTVERFWAMSSQGTIPVVCDTTSCTHTLLRSLDAVLTPDNRRRLAAMKILDITTWIDSDLLPRLAVTSPKGRVLLHPTCAARLLGLDTAMRRIAEACAREVVVPLDCHCCGAAGDRGFIYPRVAASATAPERAEADLLGPFDGCYSLARTCEISMQSTIGRPYESIAYLVDETTAPAEAKK